MKQDHVVKLFLDDDWDHARDALTFPPLDFLGDPMINLRW